MAGVVAQPTPNPQAYKFTLEGHVFDAPVTISDAAAAAGTPFETLFSIPGVDSVFATANFVTVTKDPGTGWDALLDAAKQALSEAF